MQPQDFVKTIYLGDHACKALVIDTWGKKLKILIDVISRVRGESETWDYYTDEDIEDGYLVFDGLRGVSFDPPGLLPNDFINRIDVRKTASATGDLYEFAVSVSSVDSHGGTTEVIISIQASDCYLEDPKRPGESSASGSQQWGARSHRALA